MHSMQCLRAVDGNVELRVPRRSLNSKAWLVRSEEMEKQVRSPAAAGRPLEPMSEKAQIPLQQMSELKCRLLPGQPEI
jgi:hypothetical protein